MPDAIMATTELGPTKMDLIVAAVQRELIEDTIIAPTVLDVSQFSEPGLKSIEFPKGTSFAVANRVSGVAGDATVVEYTTDKIDLDLIYINNIINVSDLVNKKVYIYKNK